MAVLHPDPSRLVVGWAAPDKFDSALIRQQYDHSPDGSPIAIVGGQTGDTISLERILALAPDLVVTTAYMEPDLTQGSLTQRLTAAGIPVLFSNGASNHQDADHDPFDDLAQGLRMWGAVLDQKPKAEAYLTFVQQHLSQVTARLGQAQPVKTYLEVQSTYDDCCWVAGQYIWGALLTQAGGQSLASVDAPWYAKIGREQLMTEAPEVYIASGGAFGAAIRPGIGPGLDPAAARDGLRRLTERSGLAVLPAVQNGRVHGVWSGLLAVPALNIVFVEIAARWLHPALFSDLDPATTLAAINQQFLAHPVPQPCWLSLDEA
jgi:iron complex transport system substrate-binding protein